MTARPWVLLAVASLLCTLVIGFYHAAPAAAAPLSQTTIITNNIRGASSTPQEKGQTDSKWTVMVSQFIRQAPIVLIQEAGPSGPPDATEQADIVTDGSTVKHFLWSENRSLYNVYFLQTDSNSDTAVGGRVNIAIVTGPTPDEVRVVANPLAAGRRALGVRFGNNWYFSIHALSGGGNDVARLVDAIDTAVDSWNPNYTYTVGGDFNRDPADLERQNNGTGVPPGAHIYATGLATHEGGGELDYFMTNDPSARSVRAIRMDGAQSDHWPVQLGGMQAAARPPDLEVMINGDAVNGTTANKTAIEYDDEYRDHQAENYKPYVGFVGSGNSNGISIEGAWGEHISAVSARDATAIPKYMPNVVLLQAGTWDIQDGDAAGAADRLSALIDQIHRDDPGAVVVVATLAPTTNAADEALVTAYNTSVKQLVATRVAAGQRAVLADMSGLTTADLNADGVTPNDSGQQKIADSFTGALVWAVVMGWISPPSTAAQLSGSACDIYTHYGTPCVGAYSTTRAMYSDYAGPLYQVKRTSDGTTADIGLLTTGGHVKASTQDSFCANTSCTVTVLYDQSPPGNDLSIAPGGGAAPGADKGADAAALPITIGGDKAYGLDITPGTGYRNNDTRGVAVDAQPEGMYMVASGTNVNNGCCFDFGNAETNTQDTGDGHMDAVNLSTTCFFDSGCTGRGPWVEADLENGLFNGGTDGKNSANQGNNSNFVTALLKNDGRTKYALRGGDSQSAGLSTWWNGGLPTIRPGYIPMKKEGAILLGVGGDNSNWSQGSFFEGVMTAGYPSDTADNAVQANIVAAKYGGNSSGTSTAPTPAGPAVTHDGYSSVYTVNSANGHLQETYLPHMGDDWHTQDLTDKYHTPPVLAGTKPVTLTHDGYVSVYTVDATSGHLQETFLPKMGDDWQTQDLTAKYGAPATSWTATAVVHDGYTSVWTINSANGHLQETYLPKMGDRWWTQDLSAKYGTPPAQAGSSPVAAVHTGYTSVWTVDANHDLQETFLPKMGDDWQTQDLTAKYHTPRTSVTPTAVVHSGYTSVWTVNDGNNHLQETYLPKMGDDWHTQDLSLAGNGGAPPVAAGTQPVAFVHTGYTSVYTIDQASMHLQESYLPAMGDPWSTQDLSAKYGTTPTNDSPTVLLHPDESGSVTWSSVFTVDQASLHLRETYLPALGDNWKTQDLSAKYGTPAATGPYTASPSSWSVVHDGYASTFTVRASDGHLFETYLPAMGQPWVTHDLNQYGSPAVKNGISPTAVTHDGYTSVYTVDTDGHLWETYLSAMGQPWHAQDLTVLGGAPTTGLTPTALYHDGYTSVYTVATDGHLWETYLTGIGATWVSQDLHNNGQTPIVAQTAAPVAVLHSGWVSVFTISLDGLHLDETYLPAIGDSWITQDLYTYGSPIDAVTPAVLVHDGYTSVYTVAPGGHLWETYLPAIGDDWKAQDLSAIYHTPAVAVWSPPVAVDHGGYASVYTIDTGSRLLQETYLPAMSDDWATQDLYAVCKTPPVRTNWQTSNGGIQSISALVHYDESGGKTWTSVFTIDGNNGHLDETYLPAVGQPWVTQDLSHTYQTPTS